MDTKERIIRAWDEADEILQDLALSDEEILECLPSIRSRVKHIASLLQDEFSITEYSKVFPDENTK